MIRLTAREGSQPYFYFYPLHIIFASKKIIYDHHITSVGQLLP
nr:MAG TPA: hypothetical protein [Caudoviricetes sp.]